MNKGFLVSLLILQAALSYTDIPIIVDKPIHPCYIGGCSGEICSPFPVDMMAASDCAYRPASKCLSLTKCEFQPNGKCEFTVTYSLIICMLDALNDLS